MDQLAQPRTISIAKAGEAAGTATADADAAAANWNDGLPNWIGKYKFITHLQEHTVLSFQT